MTGSSTAPLDDELEELEEELDELDEELDELDEELDELDEELELLITTGSPLELELELLDELELVTPPSPELEDELLDELLLEELLEALLLEDVLLGTGGTAPPFEQADNNKTVQMLAKPTMRAFGIRKTSVAS